MNPTMQQRRLKQLCDSIPQLPMFRTDQQTGVFARQLVTVTLTELFRHEFEETKWANGSLIPIDSSLSDGANEYSYSELEHVGLADIVADNATDIPMADLKGQQNVRPVKTVACKFRYSTQEVRTAQLQGMFDLPSEKSMAARQAHDFRIHNLIRDGNAAAGLHGATNAPNIIVQTATNGDWTNPATTPAEIVADFSDAANTIINQSDGVETPNTVVMPLETFTHISTLQNSTASDITVLQYLQRAHPQITAWEFDPGMRTAAADGSAALLIYRNDRTRMRAVMPMTLVPLPPEQKGLVFEVTLESRFGGVMLPKPRSVLRLENI